MKKRWIGLFLIVALLAAAGCGKVSEEAGKAEVPADISTENVNSVNEDTPAADSGIMIIHDERMGEQWADLFNKGARAALDAAPGSPGYSSNVISEDLVAAGIDQAANDGYMGILLIFDGGAEDIQSAIGRASDAGVPVVCLSDYQSNGYSLESPDDFGKAMTEGLLSRIALTKGQEAWGGDFDRELRRAVLGVWNTASSAGDRKQFVRSNVLEFSQVDSSMGYYALERVSSVTEIKDTPDGKGYDYILNTGNHYYLYPGAFKVLECHWEPDGYSGSDSLAKAEEFTGTGQGDENSTYFIDMNSYEGSEEVFQGRISRFVAYDAVGRAEDCLALNLNTPIRFVSSDGLDTMIYAIQLSTDFKLDGYAEDGTTVGVKGTLFEEHTAHHHTPVLMDVIQVK